MSDTLVGVTTVREIFIGSNLAPIGTISDMAYTLMSPTGDTITGLGSPSYLGEGWYAITIDGSTNLSVPGLYRETWTGTAGTSDIRRDGYFLVSYPDGPMLTRLELRHAIAQLVDDLTLGQGSAAGGSTTLIDSERSEPDHHWRGAYLYLYGGTGYGQERQLADSTESGGVLTAGKDWATAPATDTYYELHKRWSVEEYNRMINLAITEAAKFALIPVVDETLTQTVSVLEYIIPAGLHLVSQVWTKDSGSGADWIRLRPPTDFEVIPGRRILRVLSAATGTRFRFVGQVQPDQLLRDGAYVDLNADYVIFRAAAHLLEQRVRGQQKDGDANGQRAAMYHRQADVRLPHNRPLAGSFRL